MKIDRKIYFSVCPISVLLALSLSFLPSLLFAQEKVESKKGKRQAVINFEDELIEGDIKKPELMYLLQRRQFNFKRLIKLRENFLPEMRSAAEELEVRGK